MRLKKWPQSDWHLKLFIATFSACIIGYFAYIVTYGVNVVFWDEWAWASFLNRGQPTLTSLAGQHGENFIFFPNVLAYLLIRLTAWNDTVFFWVSGAMLLGVLALITRVFWDEIKRAPLVWLPLPFIVLTLAQYQNTLWAYQVAWFMCLLCIVGATYLLGRPNASAWHLLGAACIGVVGSYSSLQGLLVWPAGLIILLARGQSNRMRAIWCATGAVVIAAYFAGLNFGDTNSASLGYILRHLPAVFEGLLLTAGSVIPSFRANFTSIYSPVFTMVVGGFLFVVGMAVIADWLVQKRPRGPKAFCVALIVTSILFDLLLIPSRLAFAPQAGVAARYNTFTWPLLLGTYAYVVMWQPPSTLRWRNWTKVPRFVISLTVGAALVVGTIVGIDQGRATRAVRLTSVDVLANWQDAPPAVAAPYLLPLCGSDSTWCADLKGHEQVLAADHMNVFSDPQKVHSLSDDGVVPGGVAAPPLVVPAALRAQVGSSRLHKRAWEVLSTVYRSDSYLTQYPMTDRGIRQLLLWAVNSGRDVTPRMINAAEWLPPVPNGFFLRQYVSAYQSWAYLLKPHN